MRTVEFGGIDALTISYEDVLAKRTGNAHGAIGFVRAILPPLEGNVTVIASVSRSETVRPFLHRFDLSHSFPDKHIVALEDTGPDNLRPKRNAYMLASGGFDRTIKPRRILAVEASPDGITAANRAGMTVVAVATLLETLELAELEGSQRPAYIAHDIPQLAKMCSITLPKN